ncbi:MAG TPA: hypothetical protein VFU51_05315 [Gaiellaceae bacterium]|nr:hypothetical protein [Gaiellaceae bacterium]
MIVAAPLARTRAFAARREATTWVVLASLVLVSTIVRVVFAHWHTGPRYFPDEYIYAALSRSLAHGDFAVRDHRATFYAILQPLVATPLWSLFPTEIAYRLVQAENALAASLVVIPVWILGRRLGLARGTTYLVCAYALVVPMLVMIPVTISDFVAYPLAIGGVAAALRSLEEPSRKRQAMFLLIALLATLARIQYFVLVPAYLVGALALDRRSALRRHPIVFGALVPALVGAVLAATGYYSIGSGSFDPAIATWLPLQGFMLATIAGAVLVPGAVAAILRPSNRTQAAFSWLTSVMVVLTFLQASVPGAQEGRFKERYLFALLPLVALAFAVYVRNGRAHRWIVLVVSAMLIGAAAQLPFSAYSAFAQLYDAQSLIASWLLQQHLGASASSAVIAIFTSLAALLAILISLRRRLAVVALPLAVLWMLAATAAATYVDIHDNYHPANPVWVDDATGGASVTAIATPASDHLALVKQLYWNGSIDRELVLDSAVPTDTYATEQVKLGADGTLAGVRGYFLFDRGGTQATFAGTRLVAHRGPYELRQALSHPRVRLLVENQTPDGWLAPIARLRAWGEAPRPRVRFTLSLPAGASRGVRIWLGLRRFTVSPGARMPVTCVSGRWPLKVVFAAQKSQLRASPLSAPSSVRLTDARIVPGGPAVRGATRCSPLPS